MPRKTQYTPKPDRQAKSLNALRDWCYQSGMAAPVAVLSATYDSLLAAYDALPADAPDVERNEKLQMLHGYWAAARDRGLTK